MRENNGIDDFAKLEQWTRNLDLAGATPMKDTVQIWTGAIQTPCALVTPPGYDTVISRRTT